MIKYLGFILVIIVTTVIAQVKEEPVLIYGGAVDDRVMNGASTDDSKSIYLVRGSTKNRIWKNDKAVYKLSLSPNNRYVAFVSDNEQNEPHSFTLTIIDTAGRSIKEIKDGYMFSWSPEGNRIAYVLALKREEGMGYSPIETEIFDITKSTIKHLGIKTYDTHWAIYDSNMYYLNYENGRVFTYNDQTQDSKETNLKGIYISPDGKYYYRPNYEGGEFALFTIDNQDITNTILQKTGITHVQQPVWIESSTLLLKNQNVTNQVKSMSIVFDIALQTVSKIGDHIVGSCNSAKMLGVADGKGNVSIKNVSDILTSEK